MKQNEWAAMAEKKEVTKPTQPSEIKRILFLGQCTLSLHFLFERYLGPSRTNGHRKTPGLVGPPQRPLRSSLGLEPDFYACATCLEPAAASRRHLTHLTVHLTGLRERLTDTSRKHNHGVVCICLGTRSHER